MTRIQSVGGFNIGGNNPLVLIAGPCVIELNNHAMEMAVAIKEITDRVGINLIFKSSYDKANRTSVNSYRGPGIVLGLRILQSIKDKTGIPILSDVHDVSQIERASKVVDIIQIPAFLSRQTDLLVEAGETGKMINIKKGQFLAPGDILNAVEKIESTGNFNILLTERGSCFGYNNLVVDMRSLVIMKNLNYPVVFDATHSVQLPGGLGTCSAGQREFIEPLSRAAVSVGISALFLEVHNNPDKALCDGKNSLHINSLEKLLVKIMEFDRIARN